MMTIPMAELEIDDVAFLTSSDSNGHNDSKQSSTTSGCGGRMCGRAGRVGRHHRTNQTHAVIHWRKSNVLTLGLCSLLVLTIIALIIAFFPFHNQCFSGEVSVPSGTALFNDSHNAGVNGLSQLLSTSGEPFPWQDIRLPAFIRPHRYELSMRPNMSTFYNTGNVVIWLSVAESTDFLVIHTKKLNITEVLVTNDNGAIPVVRQLECTQHEQLFIGLASQLTPDRNYSLRLTFERQLEEQLEGFYVSSYTDSRTGIKKYLLTTHFEPTSARSAFPCFDEPALKASFLMKLIHERGFEAFFNSEKSNSLAIDGEGLIVSIFEPTVPMSTYLVAFIVCDFNTHTATTREGVNIRAVVPGEQDSQAGYALKSAASILSFYQDFFNITYPLSKLDLVAVPDFGAGAMENWGLITFRTSVFLYNDNESNSETQEQVAIVVAHELAHMWFGNLVTMNWWDDLWLNEGFASFMENLGVNYIHPEWKMLDQFVVTTTQYAMALDSLQSSHPIKADVKNPSEIEAIFDVISYKKGAALIQMLENFLGVENLRLGLSKYLNKYQYRTARTSDLWHCFSDVSQSQAINVSAIMDTWIEQKGYPVVSVRRVGDQLVLSQRRFLSSVPDSDATTTSDISPFGYKWIIPVTLITDETAGTTPQLIWFNTTEMSVPLDERHQWFKVNVNQSGFYRVNYDPSVWQALTDVLHNHSFNRHVLSATDRANLLDDAFSFMRIGLLDIRVAMELSLYLRNGERDYVPWETALYQFGILDTLMFQMPALQRYICGLIEPLMTIWGWKDHSYDLMLVRKLRSLLLRAAVSYGDKHAVQMANRYFQSWMINGTKIPANLREVVYNTGVQYGSEREWIHCWHRYLNTSIPSEKKLLLGALGSTRNAWLLSRYLNSSLDRDSVRPQDTVHVITTVARNPVGRDMVWRFVREEWAPIMKLFGEGSFSLETIISETTSHFTTEFELTEVRTFFDTLSTVGSGGQSVVQSLEKIRANIYWKQHIEPSVIAWLTNHTATPDGLL
ncbi:unnamed protein product [Oppiella nova]|uniref:Aminopeptidase n=1 Tax=Oppiella nova TaxID=334625 RepID=A0A7R9LWC8_9ACAR|nr:unnamed protein product [Oppiella nova]CAG2166902.1 unnamed protein product [Oppiella nova]